MYKAEITMCVFAQGLPVQCTNPANTMPDSLITLCVHWTLASLEHLLLISHFRSLTVPSVSGTSPSQHSIHYSDTIMGHFPIFLSPNPPVNLYWIGLLRCINIDNMAVYMVMSPISRCHVRSLSQQRTRLSTSTDWFFQYFKRDQSKLFHCTICNHHKLGMTLTTVTCLRLQLAKRCVLFALEHFEEASKVYDEIGFSNMLVRMVPYLRADYLGLVS